MNINFTIDEKDYLNFHLFAASKNPVIKKQRIRTTILLIIAFIVFTYFLYTIDQKMYIIFGITGLVLTIAHFLFLDKMRYEKLYKKNINVNFKEKINKKVNLDFQDSYVTATDDSLETKINYSSIALIEEIKNYYFFKLQNNDRLIIPKRAIENKSEFEQLINEIIKTQNIKLQPELNWKWK